MMFFSGPWVILFLALRDLRQYAFSTIVASLAIALAGGLFLGTWKIKEEAKNAFSRSAGGYDAVLGARGSKLQLVLNALFHLEASPGNLSWEQYELIRNTRGVSEAYPIAVGDNYHGFRLVGTLSEMFEKHEWRKGRKYMAEPGGRFFTDDAQEALVGGFVARKLGLKVGDKFHPYHGLTFKEEAKHKDLYVVVGILEATGTPSDKVIWIPIKGIQLMDGHNPKTATDVSAVLLNLKGSAGFMLDMKYNKQGNVATLAWPVAGILASFFERLVWFQRVLEVISYLVAFVAVCVILAILRNAMNERRREIAILRSLGARRVTVTTVVLVQAVLITLFGIVGAFFSYLGIGLFAASVVREQTGVLLEPFTYDPSFLYVPIGMLAVGLLSGLLPALQAYRSDVAKNLVQQS
jgi:putative ABC transport system permease protein